MDDADGFILFVVGCIVCAGLFFGIIYGIKKVFKTPQQQQTIDSSALIDQQKRRADDTEAQRKKMMQQLQQKNRDYQNKLKNR